MRGEKRVSTPWYNTVLGKRWAVLLPLVATLMFVAFLFFRLIWPQLLGQADNHDYWRLMKPFGLLYPENTGYTFFHFIQTSFVKTYEYIAEPLSSGLIAVGITYWLGNFLGDAHFSLKVLGGVHILFYGLGFFLLQKYILGKQLRQIIIFFALSFYVLSSLVFTPYFVSFYQESSVLILFLFFVSLFLSTSKNLFLESLVLLLLVLTKVPSTILALLAIPLLVKYSQVNKFWLKSLCVAVVMLSAVYFNLSNEKESAEPNVFNSFFTGVVSSDVQEEVLADFDLVDSRYQSFIGKDFWSVDFPVELQSDFYSKVSRFKVVSYYLFHPGLFISRLYSASTLLIADTRPDNLGNRTLAFSIDGIIESEPWWGWQNLLKIIILPGMLLSIAQLVYLFLNARKSNLVLLIISLTVLLPLLVTTVLMGDGWHEFAKHNVPFYFAFSLWFLLSVHFWYNQAEAKKL